MGSKAKAGFLAMLCLLGMGFAWDGEAMKMGTGKEDIPLEAKAQFLQANVEGDYETAMALHGEYGLGGRRMKLADEEIFSLRAGMFGEIIAGNYEQAVLLREQLHGLIHGKMQELMGERPERIERPKGMEPPERPGCGGNCTGMELMPGGRPFGMGMGHIWNGLGSQGAETE